MFSSEEELMAMVVGPFLPFIRLFSRIYFTVVHLIFWMWNYPKARIVVPRPIEDDLSQLLFISATQAAEMIRRKEISSRQLLEVYIRRIHTVNQILNTVVQQDFEQALQTAKEVDELIETMELESDQWKKLYENKPLMGVPVSVKDCIRVKGIRSVCGLPCFANVGANNKDAEVVARLREAGAIPLVVTNVPEACLWWETSNSIYGQTCNPYDSRRTCGGSSGGEAALIAAAGSVIGIGSDIGGSIRIPALFNGVFGLKPTPNLVPVKGHIPEEFSGYRSEMISIGPLCRYAKDLTVMLKVLVGPKLSNVLRLDEPVNLRRTRVFYMKGVESFISSTLHSDMAEALRKAAKYFEKKYDTTTYRVDLPLAHHGMDLWLTSMHDHNAVPFSQVLAGFQPGERVNCFTELFWWFLGRSEHTFVSLISGIFDDLPPFFKGEPDFVISKREQLKREVVELLGHDGILLYPGFSRPAYFHNEPVFCPMDFQYTALWNTLGLPVVSCPLGLNRQGIPIGVQIIGGPRTEGLLIAVAQDLEEGFGGWRAPSRDSY